MSPFPLSALLLRARPARVGALLLLLFACGCAHQVPEATPPAATSPRPTPADFDEGATAGERAEALADALALWRAHVDASPDDGHARARLATLLALDGQVAEARGHYRRAVALGATVPDALDALMTRGAGSRTALATPAPVKVGPALRIDPGSGDHVNEPSAVARSDQRLAAAWHRFDTSQSSADCPGAPTANLEVGTSDDGGQTWSHQVLAAPQGFATDFEIDPMTAVDRTEGRFFAGAIALDCNNPANTALYVVSKEAGATSWGAGGIVQQGEMIGGDLAFPDKGFLAATSSIGILSRVYAAYGMFRDGPGSGTPLLSGRLRVSNNNGIDWDPPVELDLGRGYLPRVGPNGHLYIVYLAEGTNGPTNEIRLQISTDGGATVGRPIQLATRLDWWIPNAPPIDGDFRAPTFPYMAIDPASGHLYVVWFDLALPGGDDVDLYLRRFDAAGTPLGPAQVIDADGTPGVPGDQFFPWLEIDGGRLHLVFYDTRDFFASGSPEVDAYYAWSDDQGATWAERRLTGAPFAGDDADVFGGAPPFLGDYLALAADGTVAFPTYVTTEGGDQDLVGSRVESAPNTARTIGEVGQAQVGSTPIQITFSTPFDDPVVFAQPPSSNGTDSAIARIDSVGPKGFTLRVEEAPDQDGNHIPETVGWIAFERGNWRLPGGARLEVERGPTAATAGIAGPTWLPRTFTQDFPTTPVVLSQVQTRNDPTWVKTRHRQATANGFQLAMEQADIATTPHGEEIVGWLAMEPSEGAWGDLWYEAVLTPDVVTDQWHTLPTSLSNILIAGIATYDGNSPAALRFRRQLQWTFDVRVEEDSTAGGNPAHTNEVVAYLGFNDSGLLEGFYD